MNNLSPKASIFWSFISLLLLISLSACDLFEQDLPFETYINNNNRRGKYPESRGLEVIARPEVLAQLIEWLPEPIPERLNHVDLDQTLIIALLEQHSSGGYHVHIDRIARQGQIVRVYATFSVLVGGDYFTTPQHVVKLKKDNRWKGAFTFVLISEGKTILKTSVVFP